jgi:CDP-diacylglycerol---glycerol-3-phosphate 3-phosphatidyltransferase
MADIQREYTDKFIAATILPFIPKSITPNQVTWVRIVTVPIIFYLLMIESYGWGLALFAISATSDAIDGAMARERDQETDLGKILDPTADRSLIFVVALVLLPRFYTLWLLVLIFVLEIVHSEIVSRMKIKLGRNIDSNWPGKMKMIIQSMALGGVFIGILANSDAWIYWSGIGLWVSLAFALWQSFAYPKYDT